MNWKMTNHRRNMLGLILVGVGVVLLIAQFFGGTGRYFWPFFIIAPGAALVVVSQAADGEMRKLAVPGMTITGIGGILFFQNLFNYYESWAYVWALVPFFVGAGMMLAAEEEEGEHGTEAARNLMTWALAAFLIFAAMFEWFIFDGGVALMRYLVPVALIGIGALFLFGRPARQAQDEPTEDGQV